MKVLVIGSSVCDVIININQLPQQGGDENIICQSLQIGGCAFNVASMLQYFHVSFDLFSPIGKGIYGDFVKEQFLKNNIPIMIETSENNGCCYCIIEKNGERTFICEHGAEYFYKKEWFKQLNPQEYQYIYICGLEIEETTGDLIIDFLEKNPHIQIIFAPSPRIDHISQNKMNRFFALSPILHLNEKEILEYTHQNQIEKAARMLYQQTHNMIIVTLGEKGSYYYDLQDHYFSSQKTEVVDTIGAGDSHIGTIIAMLCQNQPMDICMIKANEIAGKVVSQKGARLKK